MKIKYLLIFIILLSSCIKQNEKNIESNISYEIETENHNLSVFEENTSTNILTENFSLPTVEIINVDQPYNIENGIYFILASPVNIFDQPNLNSNVIGILKLNDEIEVIENMEIEQRLYGFLQYWYKIKYQNIEGYIWGGYIAVETVVYDIDYNGINDYFHYRISGIINNENIIDINSDIYIYINSKKKIFNFNFEHTRNIHKRSINNINIWNKCMFEKPYYNAIGEYNEFKIGFIYYYTQFIEQRNNYSIFADNAFFFILSEDKIENGQYGTGIIRTIE